MDKILAFLSAPIFAFFGKIADMYQKYFPPKTALEKENEGQKSNAELIKKIENEGRP